MLSVTSLPNCGKINENDDCTFPSFCFFIISAQQPKDGFLIPRSLLLIEHCPRRLGENPDGEHFEDLSSRCEQTS